MSLRPIVAVLASLAFVFVMVPVFASADFLGQYANCTSYPYSTSYNTTYPYNTYPGTNYQNCGQGTLLVYVQVPSSTNPQTNQGPVTRYPGDFSVTVSGGNPSPASFQGSLNGVPVSLLGSYTVSAAVLPGFSPTYSAGCSGTLSAGTQALCIVTEYQTGSDYGTVTPYPYPYTGVTPLVCLPAYQTVNLGQQVTFWVQGGSGGAYNWSTPTQTYLGASASLTTVLRSSGTQTITVSSNSQTATCTVNVLPVAGPVSYNPTQPTQTTYPGAYISPVTTVTTPAPSVTSAYVPALPNTGFEPLSVMLGQNGGASVAFAVVLLLAAGFAISPYVRKIIISSAR